MKIEFLKPLDGPLGRKRLIEILKAGFSDATYSDFRAAVAFAKSGPIVRLRYLISEWRKSGRNAQIIFGIDHKGTTKEALEIALESFDTVHVTHNPVPNCTFHPKIYIFIGESKAEIIFGSHNLTVGGLETNFESGVLIRCTLPDEEETLGEALSSWEELLPNTCPSTIALSSELIEKLNEEGFLASEVTKAGDPKTEEALHKGLKTSVFKPFPPRSPSPIPRRKIRKKIKGKKTPVVIVPPPESARALAIQIIPHHNGEIFLSKTALNENPDFFGWPFTGKATPKKPGNPSYPQREPDPSVLLTIYDDSERLILQEEIPSLNMVFYERRADFRITINPGLAKSIPPYSILIMTLSLDKYDYTLNVYFPGSNLYESYLQSCNITLPSGGIAIPRKMGWL